MTDANDAQAKTTALLAKLWLKIQPVVEERFAILERVAGYAAGGGGLPEELRTEAAGCAHKLAGSLGMYGYDEGTRLARELEALLGAPDPNPARLKTLILELRSAVYPAA